MRQEHATVGRPAQRSRAEITAAAMAIADRDGLDAVSMRRVAAELGTGAASLYRYLDTREDLLDLMADSTAAEFALAAPTGDWPADLVLVGEQMRAIIRRHPWLITVVMTRPVLGPNGLAVLEHVLEVLAPHPAALAAKLEAFAMFSAFTTLFAQSELADGSAAQQRNAAYLYYATTTGAHTRLAQLLAQGAPASTDPAGQPGYDPADRYRDIITRILAGLLGST
jgi:AcrR family transcriptional regulator